MTFWRQSCQPRLLYPAKSFFWIMEQKHSLGEARGLVIYQPVALLLKLEWKLGTQHRGNHITKALMKKPEREKQIYINAYTWNWEKWYWWIYLQGRNRDSDIENRLMDTAGAGEGRTNWESSIEICTLPYVKQIVDGKCLYSTGSSPWCSVTT